MRCQHKNLISIPRKGLGRAVFADGCPFSAGGILPMERDRESAAAPRAAEK